MRVVRAVEAGTRTFGVVAERWLAQGAKHGFKRRGKDGVRAFYHVEMRIGNTWIWVPRGPRPAPQGDGVQPRRPCAAEFACWIGTMAARPRRHGAPLLTFG